MKFDGKVKTLEDLMMLDSGFAFKSSEWVETGTPVIKIRNVQDGFVDLSGCSFVSDETAKKASNWLGEIGNTLIALTGAGVGEIGRIRHNQSGLINQRVGWVRPKDAEEEDYIYYLLRYFKNEIIELASGSAQPNVSPKDILRLECQVPPKAERKAVGIILAKLDEKIVLNKLLTTTLEDIAQTIFKSWFIDFDPIKAKMAGEKPVGMDDATAALFPGSMEESELGLIPSGWQVKLLGDLVTPKKGKTITRATCVDGDVPVVAGGLQPAYFHNTANVLQPAITVSASGANAGYVRLYLEDIWASDCSYINSEITQTVHFWYLFLSRNQELIYAMQQGAAQPHLYPSDLMRLKLSYPNSIDSVLKFEETVTPLFLEIGALKRQNESLRSLRDSLLPRLISGELQIPEEMLAS
jgi:type I restriction enzyme S subunit